MQRPAGRKPHEPMADCQPEVGAMLVNQDEITCDECDKCIESFPKPRGWQNPLTAEAHVCSECWDKEFIDVVWANLDDLNNILAKIKYPVRTFVGRVIEDDVVQKVMEKFGVVS